jgi:hypothetical protein
MLILYLLLLWSNYLITNLIGNKGNNSGTSSAFGSPSQLGMTR